MPNRFKRVLWVALSLLSLLTATGARAGETLQRVIDFQILRVGLSGNQPPMTMISRNGAHMGFDVDLARALALAMDVTLEIETMPFGELLTALEKGEIDMAMSGMAITPERTELVSFIGPYMMSGKSVLTRNSVLGSASTTEEFNRSNLRLLALSNSTSASFVRKAAPQAKLVEVSSYDEGVAMLIDGKADAMVADMPMCILSVMRYPDAGLTTLDSPLSVEPIGIAVSKEDPQFFNLVSNYLEAYEKTGILKRLREKWFEDSGWIAELP